MGYCAIADLVTYGMPSTAFGAVTDPQKQAAIDGTAAEMDTYLRQAYPEPFDTPYPLELVRCNAILAVEEILTVRGWDPSNAGDSAIMQRAATQRDWLARVQRGAAKINVTPTKTDSPVYQSPKVFSSSTISPQAPDTGSSRGW